MSWRAAQWLAQSPHSIAGSYSLVTRGFSVWITNVLLVPACFLWVLLCLLSTKYRHLVRGDLATVYLPFLTVSVKCLSVYVAHVMSWQLVQGASHLKVACGEHRVRS